MRRAHTSGPGQDAPHDAQGRRRQRQSALGFIVFAAAAAAAVAVRSERVLKSQFHCTIGNPPGLGNGKEPIDPKRCKPPAWPRVMPRGPNPQGKPQGNAAWRVWRRTYGPSVRKHYRRIEREVRWSITCRAHLSSALLSSLRACPPFPFHIPGRASLPAAEERSRRRRGCGRRRIAPQQVSAQRPRD